MHTHKALCAHVIQLTVLLFPNIFLHDIIYAHYCNINNNIGIINDGFEYTLPPVTVYH